MKHKIKFYLFVFAALIYSGCKQESLLNKPHIVFVTGDEEYRSEESMSMLAKIAARELDAKVSLCFAIDSAGFINPNRSDHISGLETLKEADLMVIFTRFRALPDRELSFITNYVESGKPVVGFRTSTHAFLYKNDSTKFYLNQEWPAKVFGQQWITHHGHFEDGRIPLTKVNVIDDKRDHPILKGINDFDAYSWLYHVDGGDWKLYGDSDPLLMGTALRSNHERNNNLDKYPLTNPVAWTKTYRPLKNFQPSKIFFTTLGHPFDFKNENMRRLSLHGIMWALDLEDQIPQNGMDVSYVGTYSPNNSGFGNKYKAGLKPEDLIQ